jgi:glycosyltransferase involved in cell wall biosynthesis
MLGLKPDVPILGSIGGSSLSSGNDVMYRGFRSAPSDRTGRPAPVLVIGGGWQPEAGAAGPNRHVRACWHGLSARLAANIHDLQSAFTMFSMSFPEPKVLRNLLEAMSAGLCPVVTDVGGIACGVVVAIWLGVLVRLRIPPH